MPLIDCNCHSKFIYKVRDSTSHTNETAVLQTGFKWCNNFHKEKKHCKRTITTSRS